VKKKHTQSENTIIYDYTGFWTKKVKILMHLVQFLERE